MFLNLSVSNVVTQKIKKFFFKEFQPMVSAPNNSYFSSNQDINRFLV